MVKLIPCGTFDSVAFIRRLRAAALPALVCFCLIASSGVVTAQQVYKTVDEDGRVTYTDDPKDKKAEEVDVSDINVQPSIPVSPRPSKRPNDQNGKVPASYQVSITSPAPETHLNPSERNLPIQVSTTPAVHEKHRLTILDNGQVVSSESTSTVLNNVVRGSHSLQAQVEDQSGRVLGRSEVVMVYVHRPSVAR